jgi:L-threonylcarbamoyladenylate synthase
MTAGTGGDAGRAALRVLAGAQPETIESAAGALIAGGVVSFPTDTVYALAASLDHPSALRRVFAIKRRPADKPLPVLLASVADLPRIALDPDPRVKRLLARHWPGPLTVVIAARPDAPAAVLGPDRTVGVRVPNHPLALRLIELAGGAVAATSANRSGRPPARLPAEVAAQLGDEPDLLVAGGPTPGQVPSTVVAFAGSTLVPLREGVIPVELLTRTWRALGEDG